MESSISTNQSSNADTSNAARAIIKQDNQIFTWAESYSRLADALLTYKSDRKGLLRKLENAYELVREQTGLEYKLVHVDGVPFEDIDPFTVFGSFNRGMSTANRVATFKAVASALGVNGLNVTMDFTGIPVLNNMRVWFFDKPLANGGADVQNLWDLFESALELADGRTDGTSRFEEHYDAALGQWGIKWNITMGLYWVRPNFFVGLDGLNREYLKAHLGIPAKTFSRVPSAHDYLAICETAKEFASDDEPYGLPMLSYKAWMASQDAKGGHCATWLYAPGRDAEHWYDDVRSQTMGIGWAYLGDLDGYATQNEIAAAIADYQNDNASHLHDAHACWQFQNEIEVGDVIFAKQGTSTILARGMVTSGPFLDQDEESLTHRRRVEWQPLQAPHTCSSKFASKTLTELSPGTLLDELEALFDENSAEDRSLEPTDASEPSRSWLLVANPHIWSFADMPVGQVSSYDLKNEKGNFRTVKSCFLAAKEGDSFLCYETSPVKGITGGGVIAQENDGERLRFKKTFGLVEPLPLGDLRAMPELANSVFQSNLQGSLFGLSAGEYAALAACLEIDETAEEPAAPVIEGIPPYTDENLLSEAFISPDQLASLKALVARKKNVILQGAPGTGKTFLARRLAYDLVGKRDPSKVEFVQFHQSYAYEDFVQGLRPAKDGTFELRDGVFHRFCERAAAQPSETFVFLIDEINRANVSKVFGELLMLIEGDNRGEACTLTYSGERFSVPENLYIIGMMNTADRSLALMDYALRRRFGFYRMEPAFESGGFRAYAEQCATDELAQVVGRVRALNERIAEDPALGEGFRLGHSYFCRKDLAMLDANEVHEWLSSVIEYDIKPQLEEYWFDEPERVRSEARKLEA